MPNHLIYNAQDHSRPLPPSLPSVLHGRNAAVTHLLYGMPWPKRLKSLQHKQKNGMTTFPKQKSNRVKQKVCVCVELNERVESRTTLTAPPRCMMRATLFAHAPQESLVAARLKLCANSQEPVFEPSGQAQIGDSSAIWPDKRILSGKGF